MLLVVVRVVVRIVQRLRVKLTELTILSIIQVYYDSNFSVDGGDGGIEDSVEMIDFKLFFKHFSSQLLSVMCLLFRTD